jgi:cell volume regulation protein A
VLEGESGANDPVGIALMVGLIELATHADETFWVVVRVFCVQMAVGLVVGIAGGLLEARLVPRTGRYAFVPALAIAPLVFAGAYLADGSGFLAVFVAGLIRGDVELPQQRSLVLVRERMATVAEIVVFVALGLTVELRVIDGTRWAEGLLVAAFLALIARPVVVAALLARVHLEVGEKVFVAWAGLKGAVPILLATFVLQDQLARGDSARATRLYDIVVVVVAFSVLVQGGLVPSVARWVGLPMRVVEPQPWAAGVRLTVEPADLRHYVVAPASTADGRTVRDLPVGEEVWVSLVVRDGGLLQVRGDTVLRAGDDVAVIAESDQLPLLGELFGARPSDGVH